MDKGEEKTEKTEGQELKSSVAEKLDLSIIRYSRVFEDCDVLCRGLDIQPNDVVLSITSSGDNVLNLLLKEPKKIYAVDMSPAQNAILELKLGAIRSSLPHDEFLQLLGEAHSDKRLELYESVRASLPNYAKEFWDLNRTIIESGIVDQGRLEEYIRTFHEKHLPKVVPPELLNLFFESETLEEQRKAFHQLPLKELKDLVSWYTSTDVLKKGRSEAQFELVNMESDEVGRELAKRYFHLAENIPVKNNFYFSLFNRGMKGYDPVTKPDYASPYLTKNNYEKLKGLVDRVTVCTNTLEEQMKSFPLGTITKVNLSNIFEYTSSELCSGICEALFHLMPPGGRMAYWELFNVRPAPSHLFHYHEKLSQDLHAVDRVFHYQAFRVYERK